jgi:carbon-monoxide dehydrogenase medium subunit
MKLRLAQPGHVVDLRRVASLRGLRRESGALVIGAMTTYAELATHPDVRDASPIIVDAASRVGDPQVRNRGTIGGSLAHADPGADLPSVMLALGASFAIVGPNGTRVIPADDFFVDMYTTALTPNELLTEIRIPLPAVRAGGAYAKHPHPATRFAVVGVAALLELERLSDRVQRVRVAVTGFGGKPLRGIAAEEALVGQSLSDHAITEAAQRLADAGATATGSADEYKAQLARVYAEQALRKAAERAQ